jgi:hypothetical protein
MAGFVNVGVRQRRDAHYEVRVALLAQKQQRQQLATHPTVLSLRLPFLHTQIRYKRNGITVKPVRLEGQRLFCSPTFILMIMFPSLRRVCGFANGDSASASEPAPTPLPLPDVALTLPPRPGAEPDVEAALDVEGALDDPEVLLIKDTYTRFIRVKDCWLSISTATFRMIV